MPAAISFGIVLFYVGGISAFVGLSIWLAPVMAGAVTCGLLGLALRYTLPALTRFFVKNAIESQIKKSLMSNEADKEGLKKWLVVASDGDVKENVWKFQFQDKQSLIKKVVSESDRELDLYKKSYFKKFNFRHYLKSQSYIKGALQIWERGRDKNSISESLSLSFYQRLILKLKKISGVKFDFESTDDIFNTEQLFPALKTSLIKKVEEIQPPVPNVPTSVGSISTLDRKSYHDLSKSIREKYLPAEILDSPNLIRKRLTSAGEKKTVENANQSAVVEEKSNVPPHMDVWKKTTFMSQEITQTHQKKNIPTKESERDTQQLLQANIEVTIEQTAVAQRNMSRWIDMSAAISVKGVLKKFGISMKDRNHFGNSYRMFYEHLWTALKNHYRYQVIPKEVNEENIFISDIAMDILMCAEKNKTLYPAVLDFKSLDSLPLGFFVEEDQRNFILKFSSSYREHQINTLPDIHLRYDIDGQLSTSEKPNTPKEKITFQAFSTKIKKMAVLTEEQNHLFMLLSNNSNIKEEMFYCLHKVLIEDKSHFVELINLLLKLNNYPVKIDDLSLLEKFFSKCIIAIKTGHEFNSRQAMTALYRLCELNVDELTCFFQYYRSDVSFANFSEGIYYFIDFFRIRKLSFPAFSIHEKSGNKLTLPLRDIVNCISLAGKNSANGQALQASFVFSLPRRLLVGQLLLNRSYSFIHKAMYIDAHFSENIHTSDGYYLLYWARKFEENFKDKLTDTVLIKKEEFQKIEFCLVDPSKIKVYDDKMANYRETNREEQYTFFYYRGLYLRYVAVNVHPDHIQAALDKWAKVTGSTVNEFLSDSYHSDYHNRQKELTDKLNQHWEMLKKYVAEDLPQKMSVATSEEASLIQTGQNNNFIPVEKIKMKQIEKNKQPQKKNNGRIIYTDKDIAELLPQLQLDKAIEENLITKITLMRTLASEYYYLDPNSFEKRLKEAGTNLKHNQITIFDCLAMLQELNYRITCSKSKEKTGEWLRLEQLVLILLSIEHPTLGQLDTGEGKTLVMQLSVCLKALSGKKIDLITHNEFLAEEAFNKMGLMCSLLGLKTAQKWSPINEIESADIFCVDISTAILNDLLVEVSNKNKKKSAYAWHRLADEVSLDEVDNTCVDVNAKTKMQVSEGVNEASPDLETFLEKLNDVVRTKLVQEVKLTDQAQQFSFVRTKLDEILQGNKYYQSLGTNSLQEWITAVVTAIDLKKDEDYFIYRSNSNPIGIVQIVHKDTTGRVDKLSRWGAGVHQCVEIHENKTEKNLVKISGVAKVLAEDNVAAYLRKKYNVRNGYTATLGEMTVLEEIKTILKPDDKELVVVLLPRAKKSEPEGVAWPIVSYLNDHGEAKLKAIYSRRYCFPPQVFPKNQHSAVLLEIVQTAQQNNQSSIIFFNIINECKLFHKFLVANKIESIQIFDDTSNETNFSDLYPSEATMQERAQDPGMITIATGAAGRGNNFPKIDVGVMAKPDLERNTNQKGGRPGRNDKFAVIYEIYCEDDLPPIQEKVVAKDANQISNLYERADFRFFITPYQQQKQAVDLKAIRANSQPFCLSSNSCHR